LITNGIMLERSVIKSWKYLPIVFVTAPIALFYLVSRSLFSSYLRSIASTSASVCATG
jgi:hypothetical protein